MHGELLRKSIKQSVLDEMDSAAAKVKPSARETKDMLFALHAYTRNEIYREFNRDHRELRPELWAAVSNTMRCALKNARSPDAGATLYRGDSRDEYNLRKGQLDCFSQYTSASLNRRVAESFAKGKWIFEITGVPHTRCATIKHASKYPNEDEVLIAPGSTFCVESVDESTTPKVVRLRFGENGKQADCEWCLLEREFSSSRLISGSSKVTAFGVALAGPRCCSSLPTRDPWPC
ncbi:erythroblast NAD (+)--arginine ADP-ribosyltransferase-like protein [Chrysochromulina tobinii]|uniref:NAD(P)(+)--arginine ADP-ribosyltransferase n=1 Tax=Chrysochromulina tobinii TaxID=1460289 RepID=A0A0M0J428_9EUKA|nr:erythroblast NAD (+)--arginine ADP-ribosyltransferase-like protein [Chrysochromulina tobinii]|eukprot:KOO21334.1 erythroblast NAD (+)--arginine ADP-ribosyltransferase-like protein [Chrysochromulina sp. CCMP291]